MADEGGGQRPEDLLLSVPGDACPGAIAVHASACMKARNCIMAFGDELIPRLEGLYAKMDAAYRAVSDQAGFSCEGCDGETCCRVDLVLHSFVETLYLKRGLESLDSSTRREVIRRCDAVLQAKNDDPFGDAYRNAVCVLNFDGLCQLYHYRPMICRLAGIPHFMVRPDAQTVSRGGCARYETAIRPAYPDLQVDRTELYREMALLEIEVVRALGRRTPSATIAETLGPSAAADCP